MHSAAGETLNPLNEFRRSLTWKWTIMNCNTELSLMEDENSNVVLIRKRLVHTSYMFVGHILYLSCLFF